MLEALFDSACACQARLPLGNEPITMFAGPMGPMGAGVENPPATALPDLHLAVATGPSCETAGVGIVELTAFGLATPRWQLT